ncbi:1-deoxy-D-xylulose-5-phosphate reductoisomerase [Actinomadura rubrisoli]|uniref:1-deoxy-D-xylulose 5-phosphate reductoisomerase n=1 Tax=Actinomadura rubrisoli TaxID=2530368 RepID=A0A4V2YW90_9ACTN|nr:1-deoxy-D-xylulose-5-phosphate reductoisomerase [Actinomadura rubrisoli]TDD84477.1 1-deoxy-D-xylulose-5-phosphate reductoisomerase [Actinomadura rubrisoli]
MSGTQARRVVVAGSTGSIGTQAIDVIAAHPDRFRAAGLAAGEGNIELLARQTRLLRPDVVAITTTRPDRAAWQFHAALAQALEEAAPPAAPIHPSAAKPQPMLITGPDAAEQAAARPCDLVLNAVAGAAGLPVTLTALERGRLLALANKESLVMGGPLITGLAGPGQIIPVDSEHAAIAHCLPGWTYRDAAALHPVRRLVLTCSGGPFRGYDRDRLAAVTPEQALDHPTWRMGPLNTLNSATLVNKGLEIIEAHLLFGVPLSAIEVVVHPQSVIHSMVEFADGSTLAQASPPDMRLPIAAALAWPERLCGIAPAIDWGRSHTWTLQPLDERAFPTVRLARRAAGAGGTYAAVYNAAAEQATSLFLNGTITFPAIGDLIADVMSSSSHPGGTGITLEHVQAADTWARARTRQLARDTSAPARVTRAQATNPHPTAEGWTGPTAVTTGNGASSRPTPQTAAGADT